MARLFSNEILILAESLLIEYWTEEKVKSVHLPRKKNIRNE